MSTVSPRREYHRAYFAKYPHGRNPIVLKCQIRADVDNGRTLCVPCHKATDTYGAKGRKLYQVLTRI